MTEHTVSLQPAYILQQRHYGETSLIIDLFTRDYGRVSLIAKGVRKAKSKTAGVLMAFTPLLVSYTGKSELKTLITAEIAEIAPHLTGMALYCGFYINELISCFLHKDDPHPAVFQHYQQCLLHLTENSPADNALRTFELNLLDAIGFGLSFPDDETSFQSEKNYVYGLEQGWVDSPKGICSGPALRALKQRDFSDVKLLPEIKRLMRGIIDAHLQGRRLRSRAVLNKIVTTLHE